MELKPGYKQTDVGVIAQEWRIVSVRDLVDEKVIEKPLDGNHGNIHPNSTDYVSYGIPFVMANNVCNGRVDLENCKFISRERADRLQKGFSISGDVLLTHKGTVGNTAIVGQLSTDYIMLTPQVTYYRVKDPNRLNNQFLRHYFESNPFQALFSSLAGGGTRAYLGIVRQLALPVVWPFIEEQRAIAGALSDVDALIGSLDQLIAKKRDLKRAAMQEMLTGHRRLPGFHGEWKRWSISRIAPRIIDYRGRTPLKLGMEWGGGNISALSARNVKMGYIDFEEETYYASEALYRRWMTNGDVNRGDVVMTTEAPLGNVALIPDDRRYILSQRTILLQVDPEIAVSQFLVQMMMAEAFQNLLSENSSGSTATGIQRKRFEKLEPILPPVAEQIAIAEVLSDMDAEITALEQRRDKTRALKQGMMQELLTGRTRLV